MALVDMPGYGYAAVSKQTKATWSDLIVGYLKGRPTLRRALVLVDARHGIKDSDRALFKLLDEAAVGYQVVLTKCDALGAAGLKARTAEVGAEISGHVAAHPRRHGDIGGKGTPGSPSCAPNWRPSRARPETGINADLPNPAGRHQRNRP